MKLLQFKYRKLGNIFSLSWLILGIPYFLDSRQILNIDDNISRFLLASAIISLILAFILKTYSSLKKHDEIIEKAFNEFHSEILKRLVISSSLATLPLIFSILLNVQNYDNVINSIASVFLFSFIFAIILPIDSILESKLKKNGFNSSEVENLMK